MYCPRDPARRVALRTTPLGQSVHCGIRLGWLRQLAGGAIMQLLQRHEEFVHIPTARRYSARSREANMLCQHVVLWRIRTFSVRTASRVLSALHPAAPRARTCTVLSLIFFLPRRRLCPRSSVSSLASQVDPTRTTCCQTPSRSRPPAKYAPWMRSTSTSRSRLAALECARQLMVHKMRLRLRPRRPLLRQRCVFHWRWPQS